MEDVFERAMSRGFRWVLVQSILKLVVGKKTHAQHFLTSMLILCCFNSRVFLGVLETKRNHSRLSVGCAGLRGGRGTLYKTILALAFYRVRFHRNCVPYDMCRQEKYWSVYSNSKRVNAFLQNTINWVISISVPWQILFIKFVGNSHNAYQSHKM